MTQNNAQLFNTSVQLHNQGRLAEAKLQYEIILRSDPSYYHAWHMLGVLSAQTNAFDLAIKYMEKALTFAPNDASIWGNLGLMMQQTGRSQHALDCYDKALKNDPTEANCWNNRGALLRELGRIPEALKSCEQALDRNPNQPWVLGDITHMRALLCQWDKFAHLPAIGRMILTGSPVMNPFVALGFFDDPAILLEAAKTRAKTKYSNIAPPIRLNKNITTTDSQIRIGYYSADFRQHPMAMIISELIESHDRKRFNITLFSYGPFENDHYRDRLRKASDHFIDVSQMTDMDVAQHSRESGIDIAIDLMGFTTFNRHGIFTQRCAPIQASWIGFPGSLGSDVIDYIIADPVVIPDSKRKFYTEKVIHLPCYWPNDSSRPISDKPITKSSYNIPADAFVFCSFNNTFKILPETFSSWMRILLATPNSVLWLLKTSDAVQNNIKAEAEARGIDKTRIIFAERLPVEEHLARHRLADLFLDTFPYNAHTTAVDALWAGLPLLTRSGQSFASRVAASILNRIGLPELITDNQADFEVRAIFLANDGRTELKSIRDKLKVLRKTSPLFDGKNFAKDLERAYQVIFDRSQAGLPPDFISVV